MEKIDKWMMLLFGLVTGWVISTAPGWMRASSYEHWWGIATAIGTVGTVIVAIALATKGELKEKRKEAADGALAVFSEKDRIIRIRRTILECAYDLRDGGTGNVHDKDLCVWIEETARALEATLHPKYAAFDRSFIRRLLDAKSKLDEAEWLLVLGIGSDPETLTLLQDAADQLEAAEEICMAAKRRMEAWWA